MQLFRKGFNIHLQWVHVFYILFTEKFEVISLRGVAQIPLLIHDVQLVDGDGVGSDTLCHGIGIHSQLFHSTGTEHQCLWDVSSY